MKYSVGCVTVLLCITLVVSLKSSIEVVGTREIFSREETQSNDNSLLLHASDGESDKYVENGQEFNSTQKDFTTDIYEYIFSEDVQDCFDYIWIRIRILLVVVSIYVLEMM